MKSWCSRIAVLVAAAAGVVVVPGNPVASANVPNAPTNGGVIRIVVDNDFAILAGDANNVTRMILQNDSVWMDQISNAVNYTISLNPNESYLYLIPMGGGGQEDIGGTLNGTDITSIPSGPDGIQRAVSSATGTTQDGYLLLDPSFDNWANSVGNGSVAYGPYSVSLANVQTSLTGAVWGDPPAFTTGWGPGQQVTGKAFRFPDSKAVAFRIKGTSLGGGVVSAGDGQATVGWTATSNDGGSPVLDYTAVAYRASDNMPTGQTCTTPNGTTTSCVITGLTNGVTYYFKISARNAIGPSPLSAPTASVTPNDFTPPNISIAPVSNTSSTNNVSFTVTGNEAIDCSTLSATVGTDFVVTGGSIVSIASATSRVCTVNVTTTVLAGATAPVTLALAGTFSVTDVAGNAQTVATGAPATITISIPVPTTTTTTTTSTTTTTTVPANASQLAPVVQVGQASIAKITTKTSTTVASTTTTSPSTTLPLVANSDSLTSAVAPNAPRAEPGEVTALIDGETQQVVVERRDSEIHIDAAGVQLVVNAIGNGQDKLPLDSDGSIAAKAAENIRLQAAGFESESNVSAWMFSTPTSLGVTKTNIAGNLDTLYKMPTGLEPGLHRLVFSGVSANGKKMTVAIGVRVSDGRNRSVWSWVLLGVLVAAVTSGVLLPARRRRREEQTSA